MSAAGRPSSPSPPGTGIPLDAIYDAVEAGVVVIDASGRLVMANQTALRFLGFSKLADLLLLSVDELRDFWDIRDAGGSPIGVQEMPIARAFREQRRVTRLLRFTRRSGGRESWLSVRAVPLFDESGHVKAVVSVVHDTTETHDALDRLQASEARLRDLVEATDDLISWTDMEGRVLYVNSRAQDVLGREPEEIVGEDGLQHIHPDDVPLCETAFSEWMQRGGAGKLVMEYRVLPKSGPPRRVSASITVARDARGQVVGVRNISRDITAAHAARKALAGLTAALEAAIPLARSGLDGISELVSACAEAMGSWSGDSRLPDEDPVAQLLEVGGRLIQALGGSLEAQKE